jgi:hypothetical protein
MGEWTEFEWRQARFLNKGCQWSVVGEGGEGGWANGFELVAVFEAAFGVV